jgi:hypothetical protein
MTKALWWTFPRWVVALALACIICSATTRAGEADDAATAFSKAAEQSDIRAPGSPAFELTAKVSFFGGDGKSYPGTYKLLWMSPNQWREELSFNGYSRIIVGGEGRYWQQRSPDFDLLQIMKLTEAIEFPSRLRGAKMPGKLKSRKESGRTLECSQANTPNTEEYCFDPAQGDMVLEKIPDDAQGLFGAPVAIEYSSFQVFGQRKFPGTMHITLGKGPLADFSLERLAGVTQPDPVNFAPPDGASLWLTCSNPEKPNMVSKITPIYPTAEKTAGHQGRVLIYAVIAADGVPQNLRF